jgi:hypothetical protein
VLAMTVTACRTVGGDEAWARDAVAIATNVNGANPATHRNTSTPKVQCRVRVAKSDLFRRLMRMICIVDEDQTDAADAAVDQAARQDRPWSAAGIPCARFIRPMRRQPIRREPAR